MTHRYGAIDPSPFSANQRILEMIRRRALNEPPPTVLDVGCATGYMAAEMKRLGCAVCGIEIAEEAAREAERHCERVWCADLDALASLDCGRIFDIIVCADVLEHTRNPEENLGRLLPCLRDGGSVICSLPNIANWRIRFRLLTGRFDYEQLGILDESHLRFFTRTTAEQMFARLRLRVLRMTVTPSLLPYRLHRVYPLKWLDYALCRALPRLGAQQFIFELQP